MRNPGQSLGISIVGGNEEAFGKGIVGIFIRSLVEGSPAGKENGLKVNDRILEVSLSLNLYLQRKIASLPPQDKFKIDGDRTF